MVSSNQINHCIKNRLDSIISKEIDPKKIDIRTDEPWVKVFDIDLYHNLLQNLEVETLQMECCPYGVSAKLEYEFEGNPCDIRLILPISLHQGFEENYGDQYLIKGMKLTELLD